MYYLRTKAATDAVKFTVDMDVMKQSAIDKQQAIEEISVRWTTLKVVSVADHKLTDRTVYTYKGAGFFLFLFLFLRKEFVKVTLSTQSPQRKLIFIKS